LRYCCIIQEQKWKQHREWLPVDARKAHGCAICAAALPAQKREKKLFEKIQKNA
jgi:NAD-dependent dihydropyrimidine dehydrogenase PreA subunit